MRVQIDPCTCSEHQLHHVGCDCGHEEQWHAAPKDKVTVWPKGYADEAGTQTFHVLAGTPRNEIEQKVRKFFGSFASISGVTRHQFNPVPSVSEEAAAHYRKGDNS